MLKAKIYQRRIHSQQLQIGLTPSFNTELEEHNKITFLFHFYCMRSSCCSSSMKFFAEISTKIIENRMRLLGLEFFFCELSNAINKLNSTHS